MMNDIDIKIGVQLLAIAPMRNERHVLYEIITLTAGAPINSRISVLIRLSVDGISDLLVSLGLCVCSADGHGALEKDNANMSRYNIDGKCTVSLWCARCTARCRT